MKTIKTYFAGSRRMKCLLLTLIVLVVSDGLISQVIVRRGLGREWNPLVQTSVGQEDFVLIKLAAVLLCAIFLWDIHKTRHKMGMISTLLFVVLYTGIVFWNLGVLFIGQLT